MFRVVTFGDSPHTLLCGEHGRSETIDRYIDLMLRDDYESFDAWQRVSVPDIEAFFLACGLREFVAGRNPRRVLSAYQDAMRRRIEELAKREGVKEFYESTACKARMVESSLGRMLEDAQFTRSEALAKRFLYGLISGLVLSYILARSIYFLF